MDGTGRSPYLNGAVTTPSLLLSKDLNNSDLLICHICCQVSGGCERMQTMLDIANAICRMLKYTPEHMHCLANIYGALAPTGTGVIGIQSAASNQKVKTGLSCPPPS